MITLNSTGHRSRGFSLLEVMIAVVVLAIGLLALAALQGKLTRSSADAKVRGRVAAMLSARMDELRSTGYGSLTVTAAPVSTTSTTDPCDGDTTDWMDCTRVQASLGSLTTSYDVKYWTGTSTFTETTTAPDPDQAQFKRIKLTASWSDAGGTGHRLALASDVSPLGLSNSLIPPPGDEESGSGGPLVRTISPETEGVIPIALGNGDSSAASNPTPELVGRNNNEEIVGTRFNVLTYTPSNDDGTIIRKRFENEVIKCTCQYGVGGANLPEIYRTAQWPAVWTGDFYELSRLAADVAAPGQALSVGPKDGVVQSPLCQECCRDHHDTLVTGVPKFDPERSDGSVSKYNPNGAGTLVVVPDTSNATYVDSCRVIRVDGFWRTASDMYSRQFGLLETETVDGAEAKTGLPTDAATTAYTTFVKDYLDAYDGTVGTAPTGAQALFDGTAGINVPALVTISAPSNSDYRYLHGRGLYVDYLEEDARDKIADVLADTGVQGSCPTGTPLADCILPYLPFTTINLTEIAKWEASDTSVLTVNSGSLLATNPSEPSGSRTIGEDVGTSDNTGTVRQSNSGVAVSSVIPDGVDPTDVTLLGTDAQPFQVGGSPSTGDYFDVRITGGGLDPDVFYSILLDTGECLNPSGDYRCSTDSVLPQAGTISLSNYHSLTTVPVAASVVLGTIQCTYQSTPVTIQTNGQHANIDVPAFRNYLVSAASIGATAGTIGLVQDDGKLTETTPVAFASIPAGSLALVTLTEQSGSPILATLVSCTAIKQGNNYYFGVGTWDRSWE